MDIRPPVDIKNMIDNHTRPKIHKNTASDMQKIDDFTKNYEGFMLGVMFDQMYSGIESPPPFGGGQTEKMFRSMLVHEQARDFAHIGGIGLSDDIKRQLLTEQSIQNPVNTADIKKLYDASSEM